MNFGVPATENVCGVQSSTVGGASGGGGLSGGASIAASGVSIGGGGGACASNPKRQAATSDSAVSPSVRTAGNVSEARSRVTDDIYPERARQVRNRPVPGAPACYSTW